VAAAGGGIDGTTHLVMSPPTFMQRLAARWCRGPGWTWYGSMGCWRRNAKLRARVVPPAPTQPAEPTAVTAATEPGRAVPGPAGPHAEPITGAGAIHAEQAAVFAALKVNKLSLNASSPKQLNLV
jgi:hypothetical protein